LDASGGTQKLATAPSKRFPALLVDGHPDVLVGVGASLTSAGFDVIRIRTGDGALAHLPSGQKFTLLVTDYAMPGMNGVDLARQALAANPALKVLIITGFPDDPGLCNRPPDVAVLAKPFRRSALTQTLQSLFAASQSGAATPEDSRPLGDDTR
jgi:CheY-like chemotaxis protein